jgi:hypothetical protein
MVAAEGRPQGRQRLPHLQGTSSGHEGAKPSVPYLIQNVTSYTVAPLKDGAQYYFQVALLAADNRVSARSAEVSAVPGVGAGSAPARRLAPGQRRRPGRVRCQRDRAAQRLSAAGQGAGSGPHLV